METTNNPSSIKSLAFNALERLEKNKATVQLSKHVDKPGTYGAKAYGIQNKGPQDVSVMHSSFLSDEYEERLAIAEYNGLQSPRQAERIAYLDAFVSVLITLPYEDTKEDWLNQRVKTAKEWLVDQGIPLPK
jgi:hypothetical protein